MFENKHITKRQLSLSKKPLIVLKRSENFFQEADYFKEEVRKQLRDLFGYETLYKQGLVIKTSINTKIQKIVEEVLILGLINQDKKNGWRGAITNIEETITEDNLSKDIINPFPNKFKIYQVLSVNKSILKVRDLKNKEFKIFLNSESNKWLIDEKFINGDIFFGEIVDNKINIIQVPLVNGAIVVIDPHSGKVLALSGGFSFKLSEFNRATQAKRQPGSAFKPFVYISAIKEGYSPSTLVLDAPYVVDQGPGLPKWKPSNYTDKFYGLNTMRTGIEKSRNLMTIRLADKIGMTKILETAKDFKIDKYMDMNLSLSLGA